MIDFNLSDKKLDSTHSFQEEQVVKQKINLEKEYYRQKMKYFQPRFNFLTKRFA